MLLLSILTFIQLFFSINTSLIGFPLVIPKQNIKLRATLTDINSGEIFFIEEHISRTDKIRGKIVIESKTDSFEVNYEGDASNERIVLKGSQCDLYTYKYGWDKNLPGVTKPLSNLILSLGPSVLYRINHINSFVSSDDVEIRGTKMHSVTSEIQSRLQVTYFYKTNLEQSEGIFKPSRVTFSGNDPGTPISSVMENLILDIYLHEESNDDINTVVHITPGIGCPKYLSQGLILPRLKADQIQMIINDEVHGPTSTLTREELYVDDDQKIMRLVTVSSGIEVDAIYDYNMGLIYVKDTSSCLTSPLTLTSPGVNKDGYFTIRTLLWLDKSYLYLGKVDYERRPGFRVSAWETTQYDAIVLGKLHAKVVTTLYFSESDESDVFENYVLVGANMNFYKKNSANDYILEESKTRDFYDLKAAVSETAFEEKFQLHDCFPKSSIQSEFQLSCSNPGCLKTAQNNPDKFKKLFKKLILQHRNVSPLRVYNVDLTFTTNKIRAVLSFLETFWKIEDTFRSSSKSISKGFLAKLSPITANDEKSCLQMHSSIVAPIKLVIYCKSDYGKCYHIEQSTEIKEDPNGQVCDLWDFPLHNLYRVGHELNLYEIQNNLLKKSLRSSFALGGHGYIVENVFDVTPTSNDDAQYSYTVLEHSSKLKLNGNTVMVSKAKNLASCYRACVHEDENLCESFSFCYYGDKFECLVSSLVYDKIEDDTIVDEKCKIYTKNHFYDYNIISQKKFKSPTSIASKVNLYDCANICYASEECYSFQYCNGYCNFAGYYTDSSAEYSEDCDIYTPKLAHRYKLTGDKMVVETLHTEFNLNMEQCAALCFDWTNDKESCKSFNFCPEGRSSSSCYLSKYTVRDGKTVKNKEGDCQNYELIEQIKTKQRDEISIGGTSSGSAFGIIVLFLVGGLIIGFVIPIGYRQLSSLPSFQSILSIRRTVNDNPGFSWERQVDEDQSRL